MRVWLAPWLMGLAVSCAAAAPSPAPAPPAPPPLACAGAFVQGGLALCRTAPGAQLVVDGVERGAADADGWAVAGFDRDSAPEVTIAARAGEGAVTSRTYPIAARQFSVQRVDGLPPQTVTPTAPEVLEKIRRDTALKASARESRAGLQGWLEGLRWPLQGRISGAWGNQRILNGEPRPPHFGVDIAAPTGTAILAPARGKVVLAQPDMHFEGGLVVLDHGQGLLSYYLHMSRLDVAEGEEVAQGQALGAVGATGRATGPHLCWRMRWRDRNLDPSVAVEALSVARAELAG